MASLLTPRHWIWKTKGLSCFIILMLMIGVAATPDWTDCTSHCLCKWVSGKKAAFCASSGLTDIPSLNSDIQVLDLQGNFITYLGKEAFSSKELINLQKIFMKNTTLKEIDRDAFRDLTILIELDLSYNQISSIPRSCFTGNDRLKTLCLTGNPLKVLTSEQFPSLPHLRILELEECQITDISVFAFVNLKLLENLNLKYNLITNISKSVFKPITSLKTLDLAGNPWNCDCGLRNFRNWYLSSNLHSASLTCREPQSQRGKTWKEISSLGFACSPEVEIDQDVVENRKGHNVTFACYVKGDPEPEVTWFFEGHPIGSFNTSKNDTSYLIEKSNHLGNRWFNLTLVHLTESDGGEYICQAKSFVEIVTKNVTLVIDTFRTLSDAKYFVFIGLLGCGLLILAIIFATMACSCWKLDQQKVKIQKKKRNFKATQGYYDQDKHLLDISSSNMEQHSRKSSCEMISTHPSTEILKHNSSLTIDRHEPVHYIQRKPSKDATKVIHLTAPIPNTFGVYPPPPEFSNNMPKSGTLGNIFISVALNDEPSVSVETYPDLLDVHRPSTSKASTLHRGSFKNVNFKKSPSSMYSSFHKLSNLNHYNNSKPSNLHSNPIKLTNISQSIGHSLSGNDSVCKGTSHFGTTHRPVNLKGVTDKPSLNTSSSFSGLSVVPYATLPRKQLKTLEKQATEPAYDNMGKRVTIGGSSTLSLPDEYDTIPTPPPPPLSSKPNNDFIPL